MKPHAVVFDAALLNKVSAALAPLALKPTASASLAEAAQLPSDSLVFIQIRDQESDRLQALCEEINRIPATKILLSALSRPQNLFLLKSCRNLKALLDSNSRILENQIQSAVTKNKAHLTGHEIKPWLFEAEVSNSSQIQDLLDQVEGLAKQQPGFTNLPRLIRTVASELIRNLILMGSKDREDQIPLNFGKTIILNLKDSEKIQFRCRVDAPYFVLEARDATGSLKAAELFSQLHKYSMGSEKMVTGDELIGLGLYLAYNICSELIFDIQPGVSSTITAKVLLSKKNRDFDAQKTAIQV